MSKDIYTYIYAYLGLPGTVVGQGRYVLAEKLCEVCRLPESTSQPQHLALPLPSQRWGVERLGCLVERFGNFIVLHHTSPICWCFFVGLGILHPFRLLGRYQQQKGTQGFDCFNPRWRFSRTKRYLPSWPPKTNSWTSAVPSGGRFRGLDHQPSTIAAKSAIQEPVQGIQLKHTKNQWLVLQSDFTILFFLVARFSALCALDSTWHRLLLDDGQWQGQVIPYEAETGLLGGLYAGGMDIWYLFGI